MASNNDKIDEFMGTDKLEISPFMQGIGFDVASPSPNKVAGFLDIKGKMICNIRRGFYRSQLYYLIENIY